MACGIFLMFGIKDVITDKSQQAATPFILEEDEALVINTTNRHSVETKPTGRIRIKMIVMTVINQMK